MSAAPEAAVCLRCGGYIPYPSCTDPRCPEKGGTPDPIPCQFPDDCREPECPCAAPSRPAPAEVAFYCGCGEVNGNPRCPVQCSTCAKVAAPQPPQGVEAGTPVERYCQMGSGMITTLDPKTGKPGGAWVRSSDYDALERQCNAYRVRNEELHANGLRLMEERDTLSARLEQAQRDIGLIDGPIEVLMNELKAAEEQLRAAAPLCKEHQPNGGARAGCLVCALQSLSSALSQIDYACGEPNEMNVSGYDVHCDDASVVRVVTEYVATMKARVAALESSLRDLGHTEIL